MVLVFVSGLLSLRVRQPPACDGVKGKKRKEAPVQRTGRRATHDVIGREKSCKLATLTIHEMRVLHDDTKVPTSIQYHDCS
jgi:hypothetical protein